MLMTCYLRPRPGGRGGAAGRSLSLAICIALCLVLASCGLISSDVTTFDLTLREKQFTIDTGKWQVDQDAATQYLGMGCGMQDNACSSVEQVCQSAACTGACNEAQTHCELVLDVNLAQPVDLVMEQPDLRSIGDEPAINVVIDDVTYVVVTNSLNVDTPELTVYVAPASALSPRDDGVYAVGTIAPVAVGETTESLSLAFASNGRTRLIDVMRSFKTPFKVIVGSSIVVAAGQPVPTGKLEAIVNIKGHAGL
jgi:hypothetical protein